jgi:RNA-directed DNA polymerase
MWNDIDWTRTQNYIRRIQHRIYKARLNDNERLVHWLQKHLINTKSAKIMAVHQVTTLNKGRKTAGVDKQIILTASGKKKMELAESLNLNGTAQPIRRAWIPKPGKEEKRPLGIPTIRDRAKQALAKLALEPEWEAVFENNSYGFRPGRRPHDAIEAIFACLHYNKPKYIYDADIHKCFERINHESLLTKLQTFPQMRKQIKAWLEAGVMTKTDDMQPTINTEGTPQGGVISPLLSNIALHGLENHLKEYVGGLKPPYPGGYSKRDKARALGVIRYADDFVLIHSDEEILEACITETKKWLKSIGLDISEAKSALRVRDGRNGFNFLGFQVIQLRKIQVGRYKVKIIPSKIARKNILEKVGKIIRYNKAASSYQLIKKIAPVIVGWANYYKYCECSKIFGKLDHFIFLKLRAWVFRRDTKNSRHFIKEKYFPSGRTYLYDGVTHSDNWILVGKEKGNKSVLKENFLPRMQWIHSEKYVKIKGSKSPFENDQLYWSLRTDKHSVHSLRVRKLLRRQSGKCPICNKTFDQFASRHWEIDHVIPRHAGGRDQYSNLQLIHRECHIRKTREERTKK